MVDSDIQPSSSLTDIITRRVTLCGIKEIMFDRYPGDNSTKLEVWQKFYLGPNREIMLPALNLISLLSAHNTNSAPKRLRDKRKFKDIANSCLSFADIGPSMIPFTRNAAPIVFGKFDPEEDIISDSYIHYAVARLDKGIPNPKVRPVLRLPWELSFDFTLFPNREIKELEILNLLEEAGRALGIGTFRGVFGKFIVQSWK